MADLKKIYLHWMFAVIALDLGAFPERLEDGTLAGLAGVLAGAPRPIDGGSSLRDSMALHERLQHRRDEDLPPVHGFDHGAPDSVLASEVVQPVEVAPPAAPVATVADQVDQVQEQLVREAPARPPSTDETGLFPWVSTISVTSTKR